MKLVGVLAEKKERDRADHLLAAHPDAMAEGLAAIARVRFKAKDMDGAAAAARRLLDRGGDWQSEAIARVVLVRALIGRNRLDEAVKVADGPWKEPEIVRQQHSQAGGFASVEPLRGRARVALARARIERGDLDAGLATLAKVPRGLSRSFDLLGLARERLDKRDRTTAAKLADAARAAMDEPSGSEFYLADVGEVIARCGQIEEARRLFRRALFARDIGSAINRSNVAISQALGGDLEGSDAHDRGHPRGRAPRPGPALAGRPPRPRGPGRRRPRRRRGDRGPVDPRHGDRPGGHDPGPARRPGPRRGRLPPRRRDGRVAHPRSRAGPRARLGRDPR